MEALQLQATEAKQQAAQAAEQVRELRAQLSALEQPPGSGTQSVAVAEVEERIKAVLRGDPALPCKLCKIANLSQSWS